MNITDCSSTTKSTGTSKTVKENMMELMKTMHLIVNTKYSIDINDHIKDSARTIITSNRCSYDEEEKQDDLGIHSSSKDITPYPLLPRKAQIPSKDVLSSFHEPATVGCIDYQTIPYPQLPRKIQLPSKERLSILHNMSEIYPPRSVTTRYSFKTDSISNC